MGNSRGSLPKLLKTAKLEKKLQGDYRKQLTENIIRKKEDWIQEVVQLEEEKGTLVAKSTNKTERVG